MIESGTDDRNLKDPEKTAARSRVEIYRAYLNSSAWRRRRNRALRDAWWRCRDCGARMHLQVHHLTYARLYREEPEDLIVLCDGCHNARHLADARIRLIVKFGRMVLRQLPNASIAELSEATKRLMVGKLSNDDGWQVHRALELLIRETKIATRRRLHPTPEDLPPPISRTEATQMLNRFGITVQRIPAVRQLRPEEYLRRRFTADRAKALQIVTDAMLEADARCSELEQHEP